MGALDAVKQPESNSSKKPHCWQRFITTLGEPRTASPTDVNSFGDGNGDDYGGGASPNAESSSSSASAVSASAEVATADVAVATAEDATASVPAAAAANGRYEGRRIGRGMPITCPMHRGCKHVAQIKDFPDHANWNAFCKEACTSTIPQCGHQCAKACHSPVLDPHTKQEHCKVALPRPCDLHADVPLYCGKLMILANQTLQTALSAYKCQVRTPVRYISSITAVDMPSAYTIPT